MYFWEKYPGYNTSSFFGPVLSEYQKLQDTLPRAIALTSYRLLRLKIMGRQKNRTGS